MSRKSRRNVLKAIGSTGILSTVSLASGNKGPNVVMELRPYNNPLTHDELLGLQHQARKESDHRNRANIGTVTPPEGDRIVGIAYGINEEGVSSRWIASTSNDTRASVKSAHDDVIDHKQRLMRGDF